MAGARSTRRGKTSLVRLPAAPSPLVGRDGELDALTSTLASGARLATLVGPPGTGKTRLALALAERMVAELGRALRIAAFVDLTPFSTDGDLVRAVAEAVGAQLAPGLDALDGSPAPGPTVRAPRSRAVPARTSTLPMDARTAAAAVGEHLASSGRALLVLDNFEQLVDHAAVVAAWLARAPELAVVVTSRELLRIGGEHSVDVLPLPVPADDDAESSSILASDAVRLLLARAPSFAPTEGDAVHLAAIVRRLEGMPLAIELAASRLSLIGASELRERLGQGLGALGPGRRDAPTRQATLRAALEWSWALLDDRERRALACVSLFRGSFSVEAAVATIAQGEHEGPLALESLQSLRDKSLIARAGHDVTRLRLFESIREHARERLAEPQAALRMARYFAHASVGRALDLRSRDGRAALAWLAAERENLLAAHDAIVDSDEPEALSLRVDLLLALDPVLARLGPGGAHLSRLDRAIDDPRLAPRPRTQALVARARVRRDRGEMGACVHDLEQARDLLEGAERGAVRAELGEAWLAQGRFDEARAQLEIALDEARRWADRRTEQRARAALGLVHHGRGRLEEAEQQYVAALDLAAALGDAHAEAQARRDLGTLCLMRNQPDRARAHYEQALAGSPGDDLRLEGIVRGNLAILDQEQGRLDEALAHLVRAVVCLRAVGDRPFEAHLAGYLGAVHHERGQLDAASEAYTRALDVLSEIRDVRLEGIFLAARAAALAANGKLGRAWNDLEIAARRLDEVGDPALVAALAAHRAQVAIADALERGDRRLLAEATDSARRTLADAARFVAESDDLRFAMRMLQRAIPADRLEIGEGGTWFRVPGRDPVDLRARPTLARVLDALARARIERPGAPVPADELIAAGWPGERMMALAAQNRLRVSMTTLRNLGLRGAVLHRDGGHLLDPEIPATRTNTNEPGARGV